ncbi:hypothetical protein ACLESO_14280 [Pyxidicoccus sp. 3LG]
MRASPRRLALLLLGLAACGIASGVPELPVVLSVSPSEGGSREEVELELSGRHFHPRVETDFAESGGALEGTFRAHLVPAAGGDAMELLDVRRLSPEQLAARVPEGLAPGTYDVVVVDPSGVEARLGSAYRVIGDAASVAAFRFSLAPLQHVGVPFPVSLTAVDDEDQPVEGFTGTVRLSDRTGSVEAVVAGPFVRGRARALVTVMTPLGANHLRADDGLGHASESEPFEVRRGPPAQVSWMGEALTTEAGACAGPVVLEVRDALGASADVGEPLEVPMTADPSEGFTLFDDAACTTPVPGGAPLLPGGRASVYFIARRAGDLVLHCPSKRGCPERVRSTPWRPATAAALHFASPARALRAGACSEAVTLEVRDGFGNATPPGREVEVGMNVPSSSGLALYTDAACTVPAGALVMPAEARSLSVHVRAPTAGRWALSVTPRPPSALAGATQEVLVEP